MEMRATVPTSGARPRTRTEYNVQEEHASVCCRRDGGLPEDGGGRTNQLALLTITAHIPFRKSHRAMLCQARRADDITHSSPALYGAVGWALGAITATGPREGACRLMPR